MGRTTPNATRWGAQEPSPRGEFGTCDDRQNTSNIVAVSKRSQTCEDPEHAERSARQWSSAGCDIRVGATTCGGLVHSVKRSRRLGARSFTISMQRRGVLVRRRYADRHRWGWHCCGKHPIFALVANCSARRTHGNARSTCGRHVLCLISLVDLQE